MLTHCETSAACLTSEGMSLPPVIRATTKEGNVRSCFLKRKPCHALLETPITSKPKEFAQKYDGTTRRKIIDKHNARIEHVLRQG